MVRPDVGGLDWHSPMLSSHHNNTFINDADMSTLGAIPDVKRILGTMSQLHLVIHEVYVSFKCTVSFKEKLETSLYLNLRAASLNHRLTERKKIHSFP